MNFKLGDTVIFNEKGFDKDWWDNLEIGEKKRYYGDLYDFDNNKPILFTFIAQHNPQTDYGIFINIENQKIEVMRHIKHFKLIAKE